MKKKIEKEIWGTTLPGAMASKPLWTTLGMSEVKKNGVNGFLNSVFERTDRNIDTQVRFLKRQFFKRF